MERTQSRDALQLTSLRIGSSWRISENENGCLCFEVYRGGRWIVQAWLTSAASDSLPPQTLTFPAGEIASNLFFMNGSACYLVWESTTGALDRVTLGVQTEKERLPVSIADVTYMVVDSRLQCHVEGRGEVSTFLLGSPTVHQHPVLFRWEKDDGTTRMGCTGVENRLVVNGHPTPYTHVLEPWLLRCSDWAHGTWNFIVYAKENKERVDLCGIWWSATTDRKECVLCTVPGPVRMPHLLEWCLDDQTLLLGYDSDHTRTYVNVSFSPQLGLQCGQVVPINVFVRGR